MKKKNLLLGTIAAFGLSAIVAMPNVYATDCNPTNDSGLTSALADSGSCPVITLDSGGTYNTNTAYTISNDVTINGNGATVHGTFNINGSASNVTFNNLTITSTATGSGDAPELISVNAQANVTISNVTIYSGANNTSSEFIKNGTGVVVHNPSGSNSTINITGSNIHAKYAVWIEGSGGSLTVTNSELSGYAALDLTSGATQTTGNKVKIDNSTLTGYAIGKEENSNNYGTIVIGNKTGVTIDIINNSTITNDFTYGVDARSDLILISNANAQATGTNINVSNSTLNNTNNDYGAVYNANNTNNNSFKTKNTTITGKLISGEKEQFYVDFVVDGKSNVVLVNKDGTITETDIPKPTKSGYTFVGWYKEQTYINLFDTTAKVTADTTVYAKFIRNSTSTTSTYTVTFNYDGKSSTVEVNSGALLNSKDIPNATKEGYNFAGWYLDEEYTKEFNLETPITENITLYAKFTKDTVVSENPKTGDKLYKYLVILSIGGLGLFIGVNNLIKKTARQ